MDKREMMRLTVKQLAKMSGVTVRTLHHYDQIGLLHPHELGANGYRYYSRTEMLRLQQILFYRELGMSLSNIRLTLDASDFDLKKALLAHKAQLVRQIKTYDTLIRTIDETLQDLDGEIDMNEIKRNPFNGFVPEKQASYEQELVARFGPLAKTHIAQANAKHASLGTKGMEDVMALGDQINHDLVRLMSQGALVQSEQVQEVIARHYQWVKIFWTPDAKGYAGLGALYLEHIDFQAFYARYDDELAAYLAQAMHYFAQTQLD